MNLMNELSESQTQTQTQSWSSTSISCWSRTDIDDTSGVHFCIARSVASDAKVSHSSGGRRSGSDRIGSDWRVSGPRCRPPGIASSFWGFEGPISFRMAFLLLRIASTSTIEQLGLPRPFLMRMLRICLSIGYFRLSKRCRGRRCVD